MRYRVTTPQRNIWFDFLGYKLQHIFDQLRRRITLVIAPVPSHIVLRFGRTTVAAAAYYIAAIDTCTCHVIIVNVQIAKHNDFHSLIAFNALIQFVHIIIIITVLFFINFVEDPFVHVDALPLLGVADLQDETA